MGYWEEVMERTVYRDIQYYWQSYVATPSLRFDDSSQRCVCGMWGVPCGASDGFHMLMSPGGRPASLQTRLLNLIARSYTVVKVQSVLDMTGLTQDQLQQGLTVYDCAAHQESIAYLPFTTLIRGQHEKVAV